MKEVAEYMERQSRQGLVVLGSVLLVLLGLVDYLSEHFSFEPFYLLPLFLVTWFGSRRAGIAAALFGAGIWFVANGFLVSAHPYLGARVWNLIWQTGLFLVFVVLLAAVRSAREYGRRMARSDALTGMLLSTYFEELAQGEIMRARRYAHPFTLTCIEFCRSGDAQAQEPLFVTELLRSASEAVRATLRGTDMAARLDDTGIAVLLPETGAEAAKVVVEKLKEQIAGLLRQHERQVTFGIGAATFLTPPATAEEMLRRVARLTHAACRRGAGPVVHEVIDGKSGTA